MIAVDLKRERDPCRRDPVHLAQQPLDAKCEHQAVEEAELHRALGVRDPQHEPHLGGC